jgi:hypothetical protein
MSPVEYVIVAHPDFNAEAQRLADFHRQSSRLSTIIVSPVEIYNEFSSGVEDVTAIRDFIRMLYDRSGDAKLPRYLLLFGDASYDYKDRIPDDHNLVPAFQSRESLRYASSFVTDDFFGCMDPDEGTNGAGTPDIGIGRFPVRDTEQARHMVDKVIHYATGSGLVSGPWRNSVCYIADDEDNNIHLNQAEQLSGAVDTIAPCFNLAKIYLDAYGQVKSPAGDRYPDVNSAIDKAVSSGALIVNYTGHGGETGLAHERVLDVPMIQSWDNIDRLTAFVTATCEFSRYDDPAMVSAGEMVLLNQKGGGIGLFTTSRLAYSQSNFAMNKRFYQAAFKIDTVTGEYPRLGDLLRLSKTPSNQNIKNFVLLGDPALMLAYPQYRIKAVEILQEPEGLPADTLTALSRITVKAQVQDLDGVKIEGFNGKAYPVVYDKPVNYNTRANDPGSRIQDFQISNKILFKGEATVTRGEFTFTFIVPKDIMYSFGDGKISYYAVDTVSWIDAQGHDTILIGGSDGEPVQDTTGPEISVYLNHYSFESGDATTPNPLLIVGLMDESGINTVGNGIGHDLIAILDSNYVNPILLNDQFIPATDDFRTGEARARLSTLDNGLHTLTVRAWDVLNNSSEETIYFHVNTEDHVFVNGLYNYPNPVKEGTSFVFRHNKPGQDVNVVIRIYSISGALIQTLQYTFNTEYLESGPLYWNGRDSGGNLVPGGLYVYQALVASNTGLASSLSQKMLIVR